MPTATFLSGFEMALNHRLHRTEQLHRMSVDQANAQRDQQRLALATREADTRDAQNTAGSNAWAQYMNRPTGEAFDGQEGPPAPAEPFTLPAGTPAPVAQDIARDMETRSYHELLAGTRSAALGESARYHDATIDARGRALDLQESAAADRKAYWETVASLRARGLDDRAAHDRATEEFRRHAATLREEERAAKVEGYKALAQQLAARDPAQAATYLNLAQAAANPLPLAQLGLSQQREARLSAGKTPGQAQIRVRDMDLSDLMGELANGAALPAPLRVDMGNELGKRLREVEPADLLDLYKHSTGPARDKVEKEIKARGLEISKPMLGGVFGGEPKFSETTHTPAKRPVAAHEEPLVPARAPAAGGKKLEEMSDAELVQLLQSMPQK